MTDNPEKIIELSKEHQEFTDNLMEEINSTGKRKIDWNYWLSLPFWKYFEAVYLLNLQHPIDIEKHEKEIDLLESWGSNSSVSQAAQKIKNQVILAEREQQIGIMPLEVTPLAWIDWAISKGYYIPSQFKDLKFSNQAKVLPQIVVTNELSLDADKRLAELFDPVGKNQLEKMFATKKWHLWADKANINGLKSARVERGKFNPYLAAIWWLNKMEPLEWDLARCQRVLANNLPARSKGCESQLTWIN